MKVFKIRVPLQFLKFSLIGLVNAIICVFTLNLLLFLFPTDEKIFLVLFNSLAYTLAVLNSYYWNARITFKYADKVERWQKYTFAAQAVGSLGISNVVFLITNVILENLNVPSWLRYNLALGMAGILSSLSSFLVIKYVVFNDVKKS